MTDTKHSATTRAIERIISGGLNMGWISDVEASDIRAAIAAATPPSVDTTVKAASDIARCYDLGTPDGHAIADAIESALLQKQAAPVPAAAPKAALTDAQKRAASLFTCWWSMVEAEHELADKPIDPEAVVLHYMGCGASCMVHAKDLREVCAMLTSLQKGDAA